MKVVLVDGLNLVRRIYAAVPGQEGTAEHWEGVIRSCRRSLARALEAHLPSHAACVMDGGGRSWRHELYDGYKRDRPPMPVALAQGLGQIGDSFEQAGVRCLSVSAFEADDVLATIAKGVAAKRGDVLILSTDKSMCQLLSPRICVYDHFANRLLDEEYVQRRFGVSSARLPVLWALTGDASVGFPGVASVGPKTAARLINEHGDLDAILSAAVTMPGKLGEALRSGTEIARLGLRLFTLHDAIRVGVNLRELRFTAASR